MLVPAVLRRWLGLLPLAPPSCAFICGCGHSGTSILANILAAHPEIYVPLRETQVFTGHSDWRAARRADALFKEHAESGHRILVEKTPRHVRHLDRIRKLARGTKFVLPVRDGRDVAASIAAGRKQSLASGQQRWIADTGIIAAQRDKQDCLVYRYEDFVESPVATVETICNFIGVTFMPEMLEYHRTPRLWFDQKIIADVGPSTGDGHRAHRNWQINQPIFDGRGKWRIKHTDSDFPDLTSGHGLVLMRQFGYV